MWVFLQLQMWFSQSFSQSKRNQCICDLKYTSLTSQFDMLSGK